MVLGYARSIGRYGSALVLLYLTTFWWASGISQFVRGSPSSITWSLSLLTLALAMRILWFRTRVSLLISIAGTLGLLVDWHPDIALASIVIAVVAVLFLPHFYHSQKTVTLGLHPLLRWPIRIENTDRFLHFHVLGPTGSGKSSSVLMPLILQDLNRGHGLVLMEPKGDLSDTVYHQARKAGRSVIRFNPSDSDCPHYNPLSGPADVAAEGLAWALNQISASGHPYYEVTARVQLLYAVRAIKATHSQSADIGQLLTFFRDEKTQRQLVQNSGDVSVQQYFEEQWARKSNSSREDRQGLLNRLELLWANPSVQRVLSAPDDFTWDQVIDDGWVVVCPLSLAELGESARALGNLLWHGLAQATYRRKIQLQQRPVFLYLDEFHQWVAEDLGDFLALARGYSMGLILAHQDMGQLSPSLKEAITANARQRIILAGTAATDVERFAQEALPHTYDHPVRYLARGQGIIQLTRNGRLRRPQLVRLLYQSLLKEGDPHPSRHEERS